MSLTVQFDERSTSVIEYLRVANGLDSSTDAILRALALLKIYTEAKMRGQKIVIVDEESGTEKEIKP
jgi:hypothetical protein